MTNQRYYQQFSQASAPHHHHQNYYQVLGVSPWSSGVEVRQAYRELCKLYHPDTTNLPSSIATEKFHLLNQAYATLSNPERRTAYDLTIGYARFNVIQPPTDFDQSSHPNNPHHKHSNLAYLDPTDRPLSAGEIVVLLAMIFSLLGCLGLAITIAWLRGDLIT